MRWTLLVCLFCFAAGVWAGDVGQIKAATGAVFLERQGQRLPATVGMPVQESDLLVTGADGSAGVTFSESRLLSENVTPAEPSAPVTSKSDSWTGMPTVAGRRWPCRSRNTAPVAALICPTSPAQTPAAKQNRHTKSVQRMMALPKGHFQRIL